MIEVPEILNIPPKLLPMVADFNRYRYFLLEGGRGSGKSHAVARFVLYLCSVKKLRVICAREIQNSIEESVYQLLVDIIGEFKLDFDVSKSQITHNSVGSTIRFKGCREQGAVSLKSMEGVDIIWLEEAQSVTQRTLDIIIPTIRKDKAKFFFTMNRYMRNDPVFSTLANREQTLHIHIDYFENKFCPQALIDEANESKESNPKEYEHIWLGKPQDTTDEFLFDFSKLDRITKINVPDHINELRESVLSVDFSGAGGDLCVAKLICRRHGDVWQEKSVEIWNNPDTDYSVGRTISLYNTFDPDCLIVDACGLGYPMYVSIKKVIPDVVGFNGAETDKVSYGIGNNRAESYRCLKNMIDNEHYMTNCPITVKELENIKKNFKNKGKLYLESKQDMKKRGVPSPDRADSSAMGAFAIEYHVVRCKIRKYQDPRKSSVISTLSGNGCML